MVRPLIILDYDNNDDGLMNIDDVDVDGVYD